MGQAPYQPALSMLLEGPVHDSGVQSVSGSLHQFNSWLEIMKHAPSAKSLAQKKYIEYLLADLTDGHVATVDCPATTLTPELMSLHPDAVIVATTSDTEGWWRSMDFC